MCAILVLVVGLMKGYAQTNLPADDKISVMNEIERIPERSDFMEWWKNAREVENVSLHFGYSSYGAPWGSPALHGVALGASLRHVMVNLDLGLGSLIDEAAYDNTNAYDYLTANSKQSFGFLSVHYYMIKYLSFGVGLGFHSELQKVASTETGVYNSYSIQNDKVSFENKGFFGLRFGAKAYIPVSDRVSIYLSGDYDVMPSSNRKSKLDLGVGVKITID